MNWVKAINNQNLKAGKIIITEEFNVAIEERETDLVTWTFFKEG